MNIFDWDESKHKRDDDGKFSSSGGGGGAKEGEKADLKKIDEVNERRKKYSDEQYKAFSSIPKESERFYFLESLKKDKEYMDALKEMEETKSDESYIKASNMFVDRAKKFLSSKNHGKSGEDTAPDKENTQMDKREIIREIMAICAKPADQFAGGEEERVEAVAKLAEKIAYNPSEAGKADDEDLDEDKKAVELIKDKAAGCDVEEDPKAVEEEKEKITVEDSMNAVLKMLGKREALYSKLTKHIGAFDHADMTEEDMAKYACKKLNIACDSGDDICALLKGYLKGAETKAGEFVTIAKDSALEEKDNGFENYLKGK